MTIMSLFHKLDNVSATAYTNLSFLYISVGFLRHNRLKKESKSLQKSFRMSEPRWSVYEQADRVMDDANASFECVMDRRSSLFSTPNAFIRLLRATVWKLQSRHVSVFFIFGGVMYMALFHHRQQPICTLQGDGTSLLNGNRCILAGAAESGECKDNLCWDITTKFEGWCCFESDEEEEQNHWYYLEKLLSTPDNLGMVFSVTKSGEGRRKKILKMPAVSAWLSVG